MMVKATKYQNEEFSNIYHHSMFKVDWFINIDMPADAYVFWHIQWLSKGQLFPSIQ